MQFQKSANIIRAGLIFLAIALLFNFRGRQWFAGGIPENRLDTLGGLLVGVAIGLLMLGISRFVRERSGNNNTPSR